MTWPTAPEMETLGRLNEISRSAYQLTLQFQGALGHFHKQIKPTWLRDPSQLLTFSLTAGPFTTE